MNTKKILFGLATVFMLGLAVSFNSVDAEENNTVTKTFIKKSDMVRTA
ncbi:MAG: hypothetical protein OIF50_04425 [Flavobacteriaceae bacterium]|nr:hypothetical protein [Flavobacteriaceae bacterium]